MTKILVAGGGAAGMIASYAASLGGASVVLAEKNEKLGKKVYITGKGRCNVTNASDAEVFFSKVRSNPKFLYSAFHAFTNEDLVALLGQNGCPLKVERGNRVFPVSDHASDVTKTFENLLVRQGVEIRKETEVLKLEVQDGEVRGATLKTGGRTRFEPFDAVILATGGLSYPSTGSTGDGYRFAEETGHMVTPCFPSLVPLETDDPRIPELAGLTLKNVELTLFIGGKKAFSERGEFLFTHNGISGPLVLTASSYLEPAFSEGKAAELLLDLKPALTAEMLRDRFQRELAEAGKKRVSTVLQGYLPQAFVPFLLREAGVPEDRIAPELRKSERDAILRAFKAYPFRVTGTRGYAEAVITKGGVSVRDVDPKTMESKKIRHLFFAGEVLDVDALTGGFNLQIAWSTGYLAGQSAARE